MVLLLNLIPLILGLVLGYWTYSAIKSKKGTKSVLIRLGLSILVFIVYLQLQPSYLPKGEIKRTTVPAFEKKEFEIKDNLLKPLSGEERDIKREELYKQGLPFIEKPLTTEQD